MENDNSSQSISISSGQLTNVQIGGVAGRDLTNNQSQQIPRSAGEEAQTPGEVTELLERLKALVEESKLQEFDKEKAIRGVESAKDEVQSNDPDKEFLAKSLQKAAKVLKEADESLEVGNSIWEKTRRIIDAIKPWLGAAASFLI